MRKVFILIIVSTSFLLQSCKKEKDEITFDIEGTVTDINDSSPLASAEVKVSKREVTSGTFNSSYSPVTTETTSSTGQYNFSTPFGSIESFKFELSCENYFGKEVLINPDNLAADNINTLDFSLQSKGVISINIVNATPWDQFDNISFNSLNPSCTNCVKFTSIQMPGVSVDTNLVGTVEANKYFKFQYNISKNGAVSNLIDSVFCVIGDTTFKSIQY